MAGTVYVNGQKTDKAGMNVDRDSLIEVREENNPYVGRGGLKLERALKAFRICLEGKSAMDIGASTGGFTDCMLMNGAAPVYAVDVGYGQLDWRLRNDPRVNVMEKCNARYLTVSDVGRQVDFITVDVSFISLGLIFPAVNRLLKEGGNGVALIKPQFEAGREEMKGTGGVVRDPAVQEKVINRVLSLSRGENLCPESLTWSPVRGSKGNIEYLLYFEKRPHNESNTEEPSYGEKTDTGIITFGTGAEEIERLVRSSHEALREGRKT